jgi:hypothetical protein
VCVVLTIGLTGAVDLCISIFDVLMGLLDSYVGLASLFAGLTGRCIV